MAQLNDILKGIVEQYAQKVDGVYRNNQPIGDRQRQQIEAHLITVFSQYITQDGTESSNTDKHWKKLRFLFHPDKFATSSAEVIWLEDVLSADAMDGTCFKLIDTCASELSHPNIDTRTAYEDISHIDKLLRTMQDRRASASTLTQIALIDNILSLLESLKNYNSTTGKVGPGWLSGVMTSMPWLTSGFCIGLYLHELSLLYALTFTVSKSGQLLGNSNSRVWQTVGQEMQAFSLAISRASVALVASFINVNILVFDKIFYIGIETCANIYNAITSQSAQNLSCTTLSLSPQSLLRGQQFQSLPLKLLAINFEGYLEKQKQQYLASYRLGDYKKSVMQEALSCLLELDRSLASQEDKLANAEKIINVLAQNKRVNVTGSHAAKVIKEAKTIQQSFIVTGDEVLALEVNEGLSFF